MDKLDYTVNALEQRSTENVLLTICDNSNGSPQELVDGKSHIQYEIQNNDGVLHYRLMSTAPSLAVEGSSGEVGATTALEMENAAVAQNTLQSGNCQFFVINDMNPTPAIVVAPPPSPASRQPCLISPKVGNVTKQPEVITVTKKRDEKRRATHNEVERRRRDKINNWILKLRDLLPEDDAKMKANGGDSKGAILIKACEYIRSMQEDNQSLSECLKQNEKLSIQNKLLQEKTEELLKENERLNILLGHKGIKLESDFEYDSS